MVEVRVWPIWQEGWVLCEVEDETDRGVYTYGEGSKIQLMRLIEVEIAVGKVSA